MYSDMPTIARMHREKSREFTEALIMSWLVYLNSMLNLKKSMHEEQIVLCSSEIVNEFYMLNFADLTILIKRIITGEYGKFYESISIADVLTFFRSYLEERFDLAEQDSIQKHNNIASDQTFNHSKNVRRNWEKGKYKTY